MILQLELILRYLFEFSLIKVKMVMETFPEVICWLVKNYSAVVRHNILALQKMKDNFIVCNVVFFVTLLELSMGVLLPHIVSSLKNFLTCL